MTTQAWMEIPTLVGFGVGLLFDIAFCLWFIERHLYKIRKIMEDEQEKRKKGIPTR